MTTHLASPSPPMTSAATPPSTRRRLLFVLPNLDGGGAQRVTLSLLRAFDPARYEISLLVLKGRGELSPYVPPQVRAIYPSVWLQRGGLLGARLAVCLHGRNHDVLIAALEMRTTFCVHGAAKWLGKPAILWVHIAFGMWAKGLGARQIRRSRAAYRDIPNVVFVAEGARRSMAEWLGFEQPGWRVIPNPFNPAGYATSELTGAQSALRERMSRRRTLIGIGRLEKRKGFDLLIDVAAKLVREGIDVDVVILGEGKLREELAERAQALGIGDHVFLPGFVHDPLEWLRAATVYVLSSRLEGLPTTIIEAMSVGTPVVATDCPSGPRELLDGGSAGLLVPMDDPEAIAAAIRRVLASDALRTELIDAGHRRARDFEPANVVTKWDGIFEAVFQNSDQSDDRAAGAG